MRIGVSDLTSPARWSELLADRNHRYLLVHSFLGTLVRVVGVALMIVVTMLFTRLMGAAEYGKVAFLLSGSFVIVLLSGLGLPTASLRLLPRYAVRGRAALIGHYLAAGLLLTGAMAVIGGLCLSLVLALVPQLARDYGFPWFLVVGLVLSVALMRFASETSRACGLQQIGFAAESVGARAILLLMLGIYLLLGASLHADAAVTLWAVSQGAVATAVTAVVLWRVRPGADMLRLRPIRQYWGWLRISTVMLVTPVYYFLLFETDAVMLGVMAGPEHVGVYQVARRLAEFVVFCTAVASSVGLPRIAEAHAARRPDQIQATVDAVNGISLVSTVTIVLALGLLGPWALTLFGPEFGSGYLPMMMLATARLVSVLFGPASDLLLMTGHHRLLGKVNLMCALLNIVLNLVLIPPFGIAGAAAATSVALVCWSAWLYGLSRRDTAIETCLIRRVPALLTLQRARG
ncbi:MAG: lipopolysaccharide biosynthesis protein [Geminicoccaceae bacterium]